MVHGFGCCGLLPINSNQYFGYWPMQLRPATRCKRRCINMGSSGWRWVVGGRVRASNGLTAVCNSRAYFFIRRSTDAPAKHCRAHCWQPPHPPPATLLHTHTMAVHTYACMQCPSGYSETLGPAIFLTLQERCPVIYRLSADAHGQLSTPRILAPPILSLARWFYVNLHNFWVMSIDF